jgi:hypothetical protein
MIDLLLVALHYGAAVNLRIVAYEFEMNWKGLL